LEFELALGSGDHGAQSGFFPGYGRNVDPDAAQYFGNPVRVWANSDEVPQAASFWSIRRGMD
jgi:hypothetical protein